MNDDKDESIIYHINELRQTLLRCIQALSIMIIPVFFITPKALDIFIEFLLKDNGITLNYFSPVEVFLIQIKTALVLDLIICFPYLIKQVWNFLVPALYEHEKKFISSIVLISTILFIFGAAFCFYFILPLILKFGTSFATSNIKAVFGISNVLNISLWLIVAFGLMFQFPLITYSLIKSDIVSYETMSDKRPYVAVGLLILSAFITPPDIVSQILLFIPTYLLFEFGLLFARRRK